MLVRRTGGRLQGSAPRCGVQESREGSAQLWPVAVRVRRVPVRKEKQAAVLVLHRRKGYRSTSSSCASQAVASRSGSFSFLVEAVEKQIRLRLRPKDYKVLQLLHQKGPSLRCVRVLWHHKEGQQREDVRQRADGGAWEMQVEAERVKKATRPKKLSK